MNGNYVFYPRRMTRKRWKDWHELNKGRVNDFDFNNRWHEWNRGRVNDFDFNNRSLPVWDDNRRKATTWQRWVPPPPVNHPPAPVNHPHSYPKPINLIVTVPNFSGQHPPDLFVFQSSSAKTTKAPSSTPVSMLTQPSSCLPANKDAIDPINPKETAINDEVQYLYTVQKKGDEIIEVVDLSEDSKEKSSDKLGDADRLPTSNNVAVSEVTECINNGMTTERIVKEVIITEVTDSGDKQNVNECINNGMTTETNEKEVIITEVTSSDEKQNAGRQRGRKRKKSATDLHCDICESEYEFIKSRGEEIFKARCGHMFCEQCLKQLDPYKCPDCNLYLQKLFKVFF